MSDDAIRYAVNMAILQAHRLGEPRVLELPRGLCGQLQSVADPGDWCAGPPCRYRGLRVVEADACRVLVWDRARETEMTQVIPWPSSAS
ncbi:hypothetical protein [Phenylobacterium koreense]|uniref:Uncharacterized protein n=1 Tax=Phenylobacterium koreense TaxID=266125 RepID=A0ABV2EME2_9CAUL